MQPTSVVTADPLTEEWPDHTQLPESDGAVVENFQEHPQGSLLIGSLTPRLQEIHPDGQYAVGHDSGIYWRNMQPVLDGCKSPDFYYIPGVPPMLDGQFRRSYVLWKELVHPHLLAEYVSGDGSEERDTTPYRGKFWVYENVICAWFYVIFDGPRNLLEVYELVRGSYTPVPANEAGRFPIPKLGIELGIWYGKFRNMTLNWLRAWDAKTGQLLPSEEERAEAERRAKEAERERADNAESWLDDAKRRLEEECERAENERREKEKERQEKEKALLAQENERREKEKALQEQENERRRAEKLAERLRALGIDPDAPDA